MTGGTNFDLVDDGGPVQAAGFSDIGYQSTTTNQKPQQTAIAAVALTTGQTSADTTTPLTSIDDIGKTISTVHDRKAWCDALLDEIAASKAVSKAVRAEPERHARMLEAISYVSEAKGAAYRAARLTPISDGDTAAFGWTRKSPELASHLWALSSASLDAGAIPMSRCS